MDSGIKGTLSRFAANTKLRGLAIKGALVVCRAGCILGCIQSMGNRVREGILALFSTLVRPHLEPCIQLCGHEHKKDVNLLE